MAFKTKLDFSDNRQVKQHVETLTILSGATSFGVPFSALTAGPDLLTSGITETYYLIPSSFSGNNTTTIYSWYDSRMSLGESNLSAITPSISATTQNTGQVYVSDSTTIIDGNVVSLTYTGVSFNILVTGMTDLGGGNYTGSVLTNTLNIISASTLDFTGRTIWVDVSGITRTNDLIITNNPQIGYVWTCSDSEGKGSWLPNTSADTNTYTTGATLIGTSVYFDRNDILSAYTVNLSAITSSGTTSYWSASTGPNAIVVNYSDSIASGTLAIAEGSGTTASGDYSHAEGVLTIASGCTSHAEGGVTRARGCYSHAEGFSTEANGDASHAEGSGSVAIGFYSHAEGFVSSSSGNQSHAEGFNTLASNDNSHSEGEYTTACGYTSHSEGSCTTASGDYSHAEGFNTTASGCNSHSEGCATKAIGTYSHSEGDTSVSCGSTTHAEGVGTIACGYGSHSEGQYTTAIGNASHSEGSVTTSIGTASHSEGNLTTACGEYSHAEGSVTRACGSYSHAGGQYTTASGLHSFIHSSGSTVTGNRSAVLGGSNITGALDDVVYVPDLIIDGLTSTDPIATNVNGQIVAGTSDARLKQNINELNDSLSIINKLRGVSFEYTKESNMGDGIRYGFIAQEVQEFIPDIVRTRAKGEGMLSLNYNEIVPILVEAVKELSVKTIVENSYLQTQTILAEDNNIDLNYSGTQQTAIGGGINVLHAMGVDKAAQILTDNDGNWITNNDFKPSKLTIPTYTPSSSDDENGNDGNITIDDNYLYIKSKNGWRRSNLERF